MAENEPSNIELLNAYAQKTNRKAEFSETPLPSGPMHGTVYHNRRFCMPYDNDENIFLICSNNPKRIDINAVVCGVFFTFDFPPDCEVVFRKMNILDKLNPFRKKSTYKTGNYTFDADTVVHGEPSPFWDAMLKIYRVQDILSDILLLRGNMRLGINTPEISFVPQLEGKSFLSFYVSQEWVVEEDFIEKLFEGMKKLRKVTKGK